MRVGHGGEASKCIKARCTDELFHRCSSPNRTCFSYSWDAKWLVSNFCVFVSSYSYYFQPHFASSYWRSSLTRFIEAKNLNKVSKCGQKEREGEKMLNSNSAWYVSVFFGRFGCTTLPHLFGVMVFIYTVEQVLKQKFNSICTFYCNNSFPSNWWCF